MENQFTHLELQLVRSSLATRTDEEIAELLERSVEAVRGIIDQITDGRGNERITDVVKYQQEKKCEREEKKNRRVERAVEKRKAWYASRTTEEKQHLIEKEQQREQRELEKKERLIEKQRQLDQRAQAKEKKIRNRAQMQRALEEQRQRKNKSAATNWEQQSKRARTREDQRKYKTRVQDPSKLISVRLDDKTYALVEIQATEELTERLIQQTKATYHVNKVLNKYKISNQ